MSSISTVGRPLDFGFATNRAIAAATVVVVGVGFGVGLAHRWPVLRAAEWGGSAGLAAFLAWAVCREFDPDHDLSAFAAVAIAVPLAFIFGPPSLWPMFWLMLAMRLVNRTTGGSATPFDSLVILILGGWLTFMFGVVFGGFTAVAFLINGLVHPRSRFQFCFSGFAVALTVAVFAFDHRVAVRSGTSLSLVGVVLALGLLSFPVILDSSPPTSVGDLSRLPLERNRVMAAQFLALTAGMFLAGWKGRDGLEQFLPFWSAVVGATLYWGVFRMLLRGKKS